MTKNTNIFERILQVAEIKGIKNVSDLATFLGYASPEKLYRLNRTPNAKPSFEMLEDFTNKFENLDLTWLVTGNGEPFRKIYASTPDGNWQVSDDGTAYSTDTPQRKKGVARMLTAPPTAPATQNNGTKTMLLPQIISVDSSSDNENILWVPVRAQAGYLVGSGDPDFMGRLTSFRLPGLNMGTYRAFEVDGDSMFPTLKNREMVIGQWVESLDDIRDDRVYILATKTNDVIIKRVLNRVEKHGLLICKSDALDQRNLYPNIPVRPEDVLEIWYAVWHGGFDFQSPSDTWNRINNHEADITVLQKTVEQLTNLVKSAGLLK